MLLNARRMPKPPYAQYQADLATAGFTADAAQLAAVNRLQLLYEQLDAEARRRPGLMQRLGLARPAAPIKGVYLWGGVGRGKTYVMDLFFDGLPLEKKMRTHFHRFMRRVHAELTLLKGEKNPLNKVAQRLADEARVICFDEFFVSDITDAMILAGLLDALFRQGVILVATSNLAPADLYRDGLQRVRFLPAIDLLHQHMDIIELDGGTDYRLRTLVQANLFQHPLGAAAEQALEACFQALVREQAVLRHDLALSVEGRPIVARREAGGVCWFEFSELCEGPRSQNDYLVLAREYHTVIVSNVPPLGADREDAARRFIFLVDVFYDQRVKLILSSANSLRTIYQGGRLEFEFQRTVSRLLEMQSQEYLALPHDDTVEPAQA